MLYSATSVGVVCCLWAASGGVLTGAAFGCWQQPGRVTSQRCGSSAPLSSMPHQVALSGKSWGSSLFSSLPATRCRGALGPGYYPEAKCRPSAGWGRLEAPLTSKGTRWPPPLPYQCRMVQSACLPLLNCSQKTVHPSSFLKYLHTPWGLLIFPTCFSTWYLVQGGIPIWH